MSLNGKTVVISGASRGIGAAVARMLHPRGVKLGLASRSGDDLGLDSAFAAPCDVGSVEELVSFCDGSGRLRARAATPVPEPRDGVPAHDGGELGMNRSVGSTELP